MIRAPGAAWDVTWLIAIRWWDTLWPWIYSLKGHNFDFCWYNQNRGFEFLSTCTWVSILFGYCGLLNCHNPNKRQQTSAWICIVCLCICCTVYTPPHIPWAPVTFPPGIGCRVTHGAFMCTYCLGAHALLTLTRDLSPNNITIADTLDVSD